MSTSDPIEPMAPLNPSVTTSPQQALPTDGSVTPGQSPSHCLDSVLKSIANYDGPERRSSRRVPRSLEILVQPLDAALLKVGAPFFAITRDISQGGMAFLSSHRADFSKAAISLVDGIAPGIVCRICGNTVINGSGKEEVFLTNVEFLHVYQPRD